MPRIATDSPHKQHSSMSLAMEQPRQGRQKAPQRPDLEGGEQREEVNRAEWVLGSINNASEGDLQTPQSSQQDSRSVWNSDC